MHRLCILLKRLSCIESLTFAFLVNWSRRFLLIQVLVALGCHSRPQC